MTRAPVRGYYNINHVEERGGRRVLRRVPIPGAAVMDVKRIPEHVTLAFLDLHAYDAPRVLERDSGGAWAIHSHVDGAPLHLAFSRGGPLPDSIAHECARLLRELHALDAAALAPWCADLARAPDTRGLFRALVDFAEQVRARVWSDVADALGDLGVPARPYDALRDVEARLTPRAFALCHVDAHRKNLMIRPDGGLVLLDWELALVADPLYDVAVHFHRMRYAPHQETAFLRAYGAMDDARAQVDAYLALEAAKSCVGDFWRYAGEYAAGATSADRALLAEHYLGKLRRAWPVWHGAESAPPFDAAHVEAALQASSRNVRLVGQ